MRTRTRFFGCFWCIRHIMGDIRPARVLCSTSVARQPGPRFLCHGSDNPTTAVQRGGATRRRSSFSLESLCQAHLPNGQRVRWLRGLKLTWPGLGEHFAFGSPAFRSQGDAVCSHILLKLAPATGTNHEARRRAAHPRTAGPLVPQPGQIP